jgi:hypothetical protein
MRARKLIFRAYQKNSIFSIPMAATPAGEPMIRIEPPGFSGL